MRVLDLCTGSGCLAVLGGADVSQGEGRCDRALGGCARGRRKNVIAHGLKARIRLLRGDLFAPVAAEHYDLIIANPPYVDRRGMRGLPPECRHEPRIAFDGGNDGLDVIRRILDEATRHLTKNGGLLCEVGRGRKALERAYPRTRFLWLDTEASEGEVFWLDAADL